jgi:capsular polysaccharide biosynthesis protein
MLIALRCDWQDKGVKGIEIQKQKFKKPLTWKGKPCLLEGRIWQASVRHNKGGYEH